MERFDSVIFALAPIPMWLEDFSPVLARLDQLRAQGVTDLARYLTAHPHEVLNCARAVKVLDVNPKTLQLLSAQNVDDIQNNLTQIFREDIIPWHTAQLLAIWQRKLEFIGDTINYTLRGECLNLQVRGFVLPEHQHDFSKVVITTEDISEYKNMLRLEAKNRELAETLFQSSPAALLLYDLNAIRQCLEQLDLEHASSAECYAQISACLDRLDLIKANQAALDLMQVTDIDHLKHNLDAIFWQDALKQFFCQSLAALWHSSQQQQGESHFIRLDGSTCHVYMQFNIFPSEPKWQLLQIALTDISAQKQAEYILEHLSQHDSLTGVYNRGHYMQEIQRLEQQAPKHLSCIYLDLNHLKPINDQYGHAIGDQLLQRVGQLLQRFIAGYPYFAARLGGDEFMILMPEVNQAQLAQHLAQLTQLLQHEQQHHEHALNVSLGAATQYPDESIHSMLQRADQNMYLHKQQYYQQNPSYERRKNG